MMADQDAKNQRRAAKGRFTRKLAELMKSIEEDKGSEIVRVNFEQLNEARRNVEAKHDMYTTFLKDSSSSTGLFTHYCYANEVGRHTKPSKFWSDDGIQRTP